MNNSVNTNLKNIFACLYDMFCFSCHQTLNSIFVIFCYLPSPLFQIKEIFRKDLQQFNEMSHRS